MRVEVAAKLDGYGRRGLEQPLFVTLKFQVMLFGSGSCGLVATIEQVMPPPVALLLMALLLIWLLLMALLLIWLLPPAPPTPAPPTPAPPTPTADCAPPAPPEPVVAVEPPLPFALLVVPLPPAPLVDPAAAVATVSVSSSPPHAAKAKAKE